MIGVPVKYKDFNDQEVEETLYFHLSKTELLEMESSMPGGLEQHVRDVVIKNDASELVALFKMFLLAAYGQKSEDGRRFIKTEELRQDFINSPAYDELFFSLATNPDAATEFFFNMVPSDFAKQLKEIQDLPEVAAHRQVEEVPLEDNRPAWVREDREPTKEEFAKMSPAELQQAFRAKQARNNT